MAKSIQAKGNREICEPITDLIADYLNDRLSPSRKNEFEQHLAVCPDCVAYLNTYKKTLQLAQSFLNSVPSGSMVPLKRALDSKIKRGKSRR